MHLLCLVLIRFDRDQIKNISGMLIGFVQDHLWSCACIFLIVTVMLLVGFLNVNYVDVGMSHFVLILVVPAV